MKTGVYSLNGKEYTIRDTPFPQYENLNEDKLSWISTDELELENFYVDGNDYKTILVIDKFSDEGSGWDIVLAVDEHMNPYFYGPQQDFMEVE